MCRCMSILREPWGYKNKPDLFLGCMLFKVSKLGFSLITFGMSYNRRKMYIGHACLCVRLFVCLSVCLSIPHSRTTERTRM